MTVRDILKMGDPRHRRMALWGGPVAPAGVLVFPESHPVGGAEFVRQGTPPDRAARHRLEKFIADGVVPGVQYLVLTADHTRFEFTGGLADIQAAKPMTPDTTLMAYSMTKTLTAVAALKLVEEKRIRLDDPVRMHLAEFPFGDKVLVRHLLAQTSGLPNPIPLRWVHLPVDHAEFDEAQALERIVQKNAQLLFEPGEKYAYSNLSYWYLGRLIARVSGLTFEQFERAHIFAPLGITESEMGFTIPAAGQHAKGYLKKWSLMNLVKGLVTDSRFFGGYENGWLEVLPHYPNGPAFGGIIGTARGFGKFLQDQLRESSVLLKPETKNLLCLPQHSNDGKPLSMTLGWHVDELNGVHYHYKEGGGAGYHGEMRIYPAQGIASVVLTNSTGFNSRKLLSRLDELFFNEISP
jgi:CubicO group peptidase (beta-lactamase class C family)